MSQSTTECKPAEHKSDLIYSLESKPPFGDSLLAAMQHILAMILSVMAPPVIIATPLGVPPEAISYLISMSLLFAGVGIWFQVSRPFGIGSGLLSIQATSFAFPSTLIAVGMALLTSKGMHWEQALATIFGVNFVGGLIIMGGSRAMPILRRIITPTVAGVTVLMIGVSLVSVGMMDFAGGFAAKSAGSFGAPINLGLGAVTMLAIVLCNRSQNPSLRMSSLVVGIAAGFIVGAVLGQVNWAVLTEDHTLFVMPVPFKFGFFGFDLDSFLVLSFLYLVVIIEAIGDLTATAVVSEQPIEGPDYQKRLSGGILCDGMMTTLGSVFGCFPVATFAQNNGIIQLSGVASRKVGKFCGALFILFAIFPVVVVIFQLIPRPVLGGALVLLFGNIACSGIRILFQHDMDRRETIIVAASIGVGISVQVMPDAFTQLPHIIQNFLHSPIVAGGVTAMIVNQLLPLLPAPEAAATGAAVEREPLAEEPAGTPE